MIPIQSTIEGKSFKFETLEALLKPLGYTIGSNWEYDHGYFDYTIDQDQGYTFLRVPFRTEYGELGQKGTTVILDTPFILKHNYQEDLDDNISSGTVPIQVSGLINQFQEPVNKDGDVSDKYVPIAENLVKEVETVLLP
ncbi:YugN-like family protein [Alkalicoccobacillus porphyridii]|uniref:YugN-like family protein n=1 Tax=Alkalicoccobacillus porphyridii TaxID=2597270 RepID=A0A554A3B4_9BACI|nr:YugN-like family protein [Alkalicoccobacillus porphyridii]TSB48181.1 hypothetical protein FN960_01095 [Alkalicoccobacillus porphyridii]